MGVKGRSSGGQDRVEDAGGEPKGDRGEDTASAGAAGRAERVGVEAAGRAERVGAGDRAPQAPGRRVTIKDVAAALGVAQSTVSNAYNRPDQLSAELRERVLATAEAMGYQGPDPAARSLRRGVSNVIGVVYPSELSYAFTDPAAALFIEGIAREAEAAGYALMLIGTPPRDDVAVVPVRSANVDGLIVHCFADGDPHFDVALSRGLPQVMVDNTGVEGVPHVAIDDEGGARRAAEHLLARGHERLGVIAMDLALEAERGIAGPERQAGASYAAVRARLAGYRAAVEAAGRDWERDIVVYETPENVPAEGALAAAALLALRPRPTALLAMSDQLAFGALAHAREAGLAVPDDVAVVGFDDLPSAARTTPPLTTVHQPTSEKGRWAGRLLLAQLRGEPVPAPVVLPTHLVVRESG